MTDPDVDPTPRRYRVGLIGEGIGSSLTPSMHETEARFLGLDYEYRIFDLVSPELTGSDFRTVLAQAGSRGFDAVNITHPFKQQVLRLVDELDDDAAALQAVNLVVFDRGRLIGYNTDWRGFGNGLAAGLPGASLGHVVQFGCGGAGAAAVYALLSQGARRVELMDADPDRARDLVERMRARFPAQTITALRPEDLPNALGRASGVVNATPLGMLRHPGVAFDIDLLREGAWVSEIVYRPLETELLRTALRRGHPVLDGGRMAVGQASASLHIITGREPDIERMQRHFGSLIRAEEQAGTVADDRPVR